MLTASKSELKRLFTQDPIGTADKVYDLIKLQEAQIDLLSRSLLEKGQALKQALLKLGHKNVGLRNESS